MNSEPPPPPPARAIFPPTLSGPWQGMIVGGLLLLYIVMALSATIQSSNVFDEPDHIASGYLYWKHPSFVRLSPENGVAAQAWAALPLVLNPALKFPQLDEDSWKKTDIWSPAHQFVYTMGNDPGAILLSSRAMISLLGAALGLLVFLWSRELFGPWGALISLTLFVFSPTILAHGALATTDMAATLGFFAASFAFWKLSHTVSWATLAFSVGSLAFLVLSKMSSPLIVPIFALILFVRVISERPVKSRAVRKTWRTTLEKTGVYSALLVVHLIAVVGLLWLLYNFNYAPLGAEEQRLKILHAPDFSFLKGASRNAFILQGISNAHLLPAAYIEGLSTSLNATDLRSAFLCGQFSRSGWWWFFPFAFIIKTPITTLCLFLTSVVALAGWKRISFREIPGPAQARQRLKFYDLAPLLILGGLYGMACLTSHINIGHRHMMPIYPVLFVLAGANAIWLMEGKRLFQVGLGVLLIGAAIESLSARPYYVAFFNAFVGGPRNGYHYLVDSSLDWGQDLPGLHRWLEKNVPAGDGTKIYLSYFGSGDPHFYGIDATYLTCFFPRGGPQTFPLRGGVYCISATMLQSVYGNFHRPWSAANEHWYALAKSEMERWNATENYPAARANLIAENGQKYWDDVPDTFSQLRFARLCAYLRPRQPDAEIGYTIMVYRLSDADIEQAIAGPLPEEKTGWAQ